MTITGNLTDSSWDGALRSFMEQSVLDSLVVVAEGNEHYIMRQTAACYARW